MEPVLVGQVGSDLPARVRSVAFGATLRKERPPQLHVLGRGRDGEDAVVGDFKCNRVIPGIAINCGPAEGPGFRIKIGPRRDVFGPCALTAAILGVQNPVAYRFRPLSARTLAGGNGAISLRKVAISLREM